MRRIALLLTLLGCFHAFPVFAATPVDSDVRAVVAGLERAFGEAAAGSIRNFHARFRQQAHIASLDRVQEGAGEVWVQFRAGGELPAFRWEYREPVPQTIVSDGKTVSVYLPENRQVLVSEVAAFDRAEDPLLFLTALGSISREFEAAPASPWRDEAGNYRLELTPRQPSPYFQKLLLTVRPQAGAKGTQPPFPLQEVSVLDTIGNRTLIRFVEAKTNLKPDPALFRFEPPPGVEVVRPGQPGSPF